MTRALVYCGFQHQPALSLPSAGVQASPVHIASFGSLRLLWSEVAWPFPQENMQQSAVEFHGVVHHVFKQTAVIPFRLLSVLDDEAAMLQFAEENQASFTEDLERLKDFVQMEFVVYPAPQQASPAVPADASSGKAYLEQKARALHSSAGYARAAQDAVVHLSHDVRVRETKSGTRIFVLIKRGQEKDFHNAASAAPVPEHLSRRISGPWPAAEFLSDRVKAPQITMSGAK
ncbi:MAG TPA: GvpL/GvpF family gas vesicle protein [Candidatus Angelobacter sp.]|nr:GvpL/GvpF family gas vesicle protein [Candidatus Angelobacter sp.]